MAFQLTAPFNSQWQQCKRFLFLPFRRFAILLYSVSMPMAEFCSIAQHTQLILKHAESITQRHNEKCSWTRYRSRWRPPFAPHFAQTLASSFCVAEKQIYAQPHFKYCQYVVSVQYGLHTNRQITPNSHAQTGTQARTVPATTGMREIVTRPCSSEHTRTLVRRRLL